MAQSPNSDHRARLIREMSRDPGRTRPSSRSSKGSSNKAESTTSDFDPGNEALMSTQRLENTTQRLPELRASAQKYGRYNRPEPDYAINTSAIGRAFPDFSQGGISSDEESMSIEIGRGLPKGENRKSDSLARSGDYSNIGDNSLDYSPAMVGNYQVMSTPPKRPGQNTKRSSNDSMRRNAQVRRASSLQNGNVEPSPPAAKATDYGSAGSRHSSTEQRRTLGSIHARVAGEADSDVSDDRPPTLNLTARNTRFGSGRSGRLPVTTSLPAKFNSTQGFVTAAVQGTGPKQPVSKAPVTNGTLSSINPGTQQSFMLPDMPNISELVSGIFEDGTPVFSRHGKSRASRFSTATRSQKAGVRMPSHARLEEIPVPEDEQAIFMSLQLLQDKVASLENGMADAEATIQELRALNQALEDEKKETKRFRRSDSALGTSGGSDAGDEAGHVQRKWIIEKTRLESTIRTLQEQTHTANHKNSMYEIAIRNLTQERDSAISQLSVAYLTTEQLKAENERLVEANMLMRSKFSQSKLGEETDTQHLTQREEGLYTKNQRRDRALEEPHEQSRKPVRPQRAGPKASRDDGRSQEDRKTTSASEIKLPETHTGETEVLRKRKTRMVLEEYSESETTNDSIDGASIEVDQTDGHARPLTREVEHPDTVHATTGDMTFLSFLESGEVAKIRKTLEQERIARKQRLGKGSNTAGRAADASRVSSTIPLPRKSSMKDLTGRVSNKADETIRTETEIDQTFQSKQSTTHHRRHSEHSLLEHRNQRYGIGMEEMTSAFILPDITIQNPLEETPKVSAAPQHVFDNRTRHDGQNCTVCKRVIEHGSHHDHEKPVKETIKIRKPIPVSERMPEAGPYDEEPTIRPSQPPPVALAVVIKGLEDELAHIKIQLAQYQTLYNQHDPSLSKRRRKSVLAKIEKLTQAVDSKSDQIYALYDVLEGQKADGHEITEEEVEMTLQSIGIDIAGLGLRGGDLPEGDGKKERPVWDLESGDESEAGLPWEGIDTTADLTTKSGEPRRKSWAA